MSSASAIFTTVFAILAATKLFQPTPAPTTARGSVTMSQTTLHVVPWVASIFHALFTVQSILIILILFHPRKHRSILQEEPIGLMGSTNLLHCSETIEKVVGEAYNDTKFDGKLRKYLKDMYKLEDAWCSMRSSLEGPRREDYY
jgi:hypothetical protein